MAVVLGTTRENIKIIIRRDDALAEDLTHEEWEAYTGTLDESKLRFKDGKKPTKFIMKRHLTYAAQQNVTNMQMGINADGKPEIKLAYIMEEVRCALIGIENPSDIPEEAKLLYIKEIDGFASKEMISEFYGAGIVMELYNIRQTVMAGNSSSKK